MSENNQIIKLIENAAKHFYGTKKSHEFYNELARLGGKAKTIKQQKNKLEVQELLFSDGKSTGFALYSAFTARDGWEMWTQKMDVAI